MEKDKILVTCFDEKFEEEEPLQPQEPQDDEEPSELTMIGEALAAARKAFQDCLLDKHCVEPAFFRLSLKVEFRDSSFTETLAELTYKDMH